MAGEMKAPPPIEPAAHADPWSRHDRATEAAGRPVAEPPRPGPRDGRTPGPGRAGRAPGPPRDGRKTRAAADGPTGAPPPAGQPLPVRRARGACSDGT